MDNDKNKYIKYLSIFLFFSSLYRLILGNLFPVTADESYYWLWSKHPDLSYVDHPPVVSYINFLTTGGQANLFSLRFGPLIITLLVSIIIYFLAKDCFNEKVAFWSSVLFNITPHFLVVWITMFVEVPFCLFWILSILILSKIIKYQKPHYWYLLGIAIGLGYMSKYTMFLFWPCLLLFFILFKENLFWLKRKEIYISFIISFLIFLPVIFWNIHHNWISFGFHEARLINSGWNGNFIGVIGEQPVHFNPFFIFILYPVFRYALKTNNMTGLLFSFSCPVLLIFLILSLKTTVWSHWPSAGYICAMPLAIGYLYEKGKSIKNFFLYIMGFNLLVLIFLFFIYPGIFLHQKDYLLNYKSSNLNEEYKIFAKNNVSVSLLEFYSGKNVYMATGFFKTGPMWGEKQYEIWGIPPLKHGETIFYYGEDTKEFREIAMKHFEKITETGLRLYLLEDYLNHFKIFKLEGYKGNGGHP